MNNPNKKIKKGRYNFLIDEPTYRAFSQVCADAGIVRSKNLENYMKEFINSHKRK